MEYKNVPLEWVLPAVDTVERVILEPLVSISTPMVTVVSDSGSHLTDASTVVGAILLLYISKKLIDKLFAKTRENK